MDDIIVKSLSAQFVLLLQNEKNMHPYHNTHLTQFYFEHAPTRHHLRVSGARQKMAAQATGHGANHIASIMYAAHWARTLLHSQSLGYRYVVLLAKLRLLSGLAERRIQSFLTSQATGSDSMRFNFFLSRFQYSDFCGEAYCSFPSLVAFKTIICNS